MVYVALIFALVFSNAVNAFDMDYTYALHAEIALSDHENISAESHPILYQLVEEVVREANVPMPQYIKVSQAKNQKFVDDHGHIHESSGEIVVKSTLFGDLHISRQLLQHATYQEARGIIALAVADKLMHVPHAKILSLIVSCIVSLSALVYLINHRKNEPATHRKVKSKNYTEIIKGLLVLNCAFWHKVIGNNLQKKVDLKAVSLVGKDVVKKSIEKINKVQKSYFQESCITRALSALELTNFVNMVLYPVRAYTLPERLAYIEKGV